MHGCITINRFQNQTAGEKENFIHIGQLIFRVLDLSEALAWTGLDVGLALWELASTAVPHYALWRYLARNFAEGLTLWEQTYQHQYENEMFAQSA